MIRVGDIDMYSFINDILTVNNNRIFTICLINLHHLLIKFDFMQYNLSISTTKIASRPSPAQRRTAEPARCSSAGDVGTSPNLAAGSHHCWGPVAVAQPTTVVSSVHLD